MTKQRLLAPGPTPVPDEVLLAMARPIMHHRQPGFSKLFKEVAEGLGWLFQTQQPVIVLAATGTGAMEAAVTNFLARGDRVLVVRGGKFGERWEEIARAYGFAPQCLDVEWGRAVDPAAVRRALDADPSIRAVLWQASETSTGARHPVREIAELCKGRETLSIVDAITATGVFEVAMDDWGIDVVVSGSQKAMMLPPGLGFLAASERAWKARERSDLPRYYFDLAKERKSQADGQTAFTPAVSLIVGLREALAALRAEGLPNVWARHERLARATREAMLALGLELYAAESPAPACTAVRAPKGVEGGAIVKRLRDRYGITIAGGQGKAKGVIFRIAHIGWYDELDLLQGIAAVEMALADVGVAIERGRGVAAAQKILSAP